MLLSVIAVSCGSRHLSPKETEARLKETMEAYLQKNAADSVRFTVTEVIYFPEGTYYDCDFRVRMQTPTQDTTGGMSATISADFQSVDRSQ